MTEIPAGFVMPNFGPRAAAPSPAQGQFVSAPVSSGPRKMAFICSKGNLDMAYPALIMGNAALGEGCEVHIFFTFWGLDIINKKLNHKLQLTLSGNTAMHMADLGRLRPGLEYRSMPQQLGGLPGMTAFATRMMKQQMADLEIPDVPQFLDLAALDRDDDVCVYFRSSSTMAAGATARLTVEDRSGAGGATLLERRYRALRPPEMERIRAAADSLAVGLASPAQPGLMRPSGDTAVASTITRPAPPRAMLA